MHIIHMYLCGESMVLTLSFIKTPKKFSYFTIFMHTNFIFFFPVSSTWIYMTNVEQPEQDMKKEPLEQARVGHSCNSPRKHTLCADISR